MRYDYEVDGMRLTRWNPKTEKSAFLALAGNKEAAKRLALADFNRLCNLAKKEISCRFDYNGDGWESL